MHLELSLFTLDVLNFFSPTRIIQIYAIKSLAFQVSKMGLRNFLAQLVSILRAKLYKVVKRGKKKFFYFAALLSKFMFLRMCHFFLTYWLCNQLNFSVAAYIYQVHNSDEAFFHFNINMHMMNKLFRVVARSSQP